MRMRMEVLTGPERRRRWSDEEKSGIVREAQEPGVRYADVARRHDISAAQLYQWRVAVREGRLIGPCGGSMGFLEVAPAALEVAAAGEAPVIATPIEIALPSGRVLKAPSSLPTAELKRLIRAVEDA
jgi:transposase